MADVERALVWKAIASGELEAVIARGVEVDHFADDEVADVFDYSSNFFQEHKQPPPIDVIRDEFPDFRAKLSKAPLSHHLKMFVRQVKEREAVSLARDYFESLEDPEEIDEIDVRAVEMAQRLAELVPSPRAERLSEGTKRKREYDRRKKAGELHGILLGIPTFDDITLGVQPHELLIYAGPPGAGKTTGMMHTMLSAYFQNKVGLFISLEVEAEQILRRFDVMMSKVRARALKALELDVGEEKQWHEILDRCEAERLEHDIIIRDDIRNCTAQKVTAEIYRHKPDIVCVDYLEEMSTPKGSSGWEGVQDNGRALKQNARVMKIPHVTGTQVNTQTNDPGYQSTRKIADMMIQLDPDEENDARGKMTYRLRKYRDGPSNKTVEMKWDLERGDIRELGVPDRFPKRKSLSRKERRKEQRLEVANVVGDKPNPWTTGKNKKSKSKSKSKKKGGVNPWVARIAA